MPTKEAFMATVTRERGYGRNDNEMSMAISQQSGTK
jgi:hypothetical protein